MTLSEFNVLDKEQQAKAIWSGTRVATRCDEEHEVVLYQIDGLFVEVFFDMTYEELIKIEAIGNVNQLLIYLKPYEAKQNRIGKNV
jgi:hypothetical protein